MTTSFQKLLPLLSIILIVALLISIIFYPDSSSLLALTVIVFSLGMAIFTIVQKRLKMRKEGKTTRIESTRGILLDILGLFLAILAASYCGGKAGAWAGEYFPLPQIGEGPGQTGETYNFWSALAAGMVVGFTVAIIVKKVWEKITTKRTQVSSARV